MTRHRAATAALALFVAGLLGGVIAQIGGWLTAAYICSAPLMLLLALFVGFGGLMRSRTITWTVVALGFSFLGDAFGFTLLLKIGLFVCAQICFVVAFWPLRRRSVVVKPVVLGVYVVAVGALVAYVASRAGSFAVPVIVYGICLGAMAVLSTGVGPMAGIGGVLFLLSDIELAVVYFVDPNLIPHSGLVNLVLYAPGQALIAYGVHRLSRRVAPPTGPVPVTAG